MQMAQATKSAVGTYEPLEDSGSTVIDIGFPCNAFFMIVTDATLVSGKRQFGTISWAKNNGVEYISSICSNSAGTNYTATSVSPGISSNSVVVPSGNSVTVSANNVITGCKFISGKQYKWFAFA